MQTLLCLVLTSTLACTGSSPIVQRGAYRRDKRKAQKDTRPPLRKGLGLQERRIYFSASQTSSKRRFIQWLGWGV